MITIKISRDRMRVLKASPSVIVGAVPHGSPKPIHFVPSNLPKRAIDRSPKDWIEVGKLVPDGRFIAKLAEADIAKLEGAERDMHEMARRLHHRRLTVASIHMAVDKITAESINQEK